MKINIGKNTLGDSNKMSVSLREYGRSTHDLSYAWRSPMGVGTLVPFMKLLALPGDTFDIDLDTKVLTHPTVGPLFGQFKMQLDVFTCPLRLYQAQLHNNALNIGLDMKTVKLPKFAHSYKSIEGATREGTRRSGVGSLAEYFGLRYEPFRDTVTNVNAIPYFAYYDVFKNFYANKQEEYFMIMGGSVIVNATTVTSTDFTGEIVEYVNDTLKCKTVSTVTITGTDVSLDNIKKIEYIIDTQPIYIYIKDSAGRTLWDVVSSKKNEIVIETKLGYYYQISRPVQGSVGQNITFKGTTENIAQGTEVKAYTSSYKLEEIDN